MDKFACAVQEEARVKYANMLTKGTLHELQWTSWTSMIWQGSICFDMFRFDKCWILCWILCSGVCTFSRIQGHGICNGTARGRPHLHHRTLEAEAEISWVDFHRFPKADHFRVTGTWSISESFEASPNSTDKSGTILTTSCCSHSQAQCLWLLRIEEPLQCQFPSFGCGRSFCVSQWLLRDCTVWSFSWLGTLSAVFGRQCSLERYACVHSP